MRHLLTHSSTGLLLFVCACSDRQPTRPERAPTRQAVVPGGQLSVIVPIQDAPTPPTDITIDGDALGCFGDGCTPTDVAFTSVSGTTIQYVSSIGTDFLGTTVNGVLGVNGPALGGSPPSSGNFGAIGVNLATQPVPATVPFTLRLTFRSPTAAPISIGATLRGTLSVPTRGGIVLTFDEKRLAGSGTVRIDFVNLNTGTPGRMDLTLFGEPIISFQNMPIGGFFQVR